MAGKKRRKRKIERVAAATARTWIRGIKLRALAWVVAILLAAVATVVFAGIPAWPVVGVAVAAACMSVGKLTSRLTRPTCLECGHDLSGLPVGTQGIACPDCGSINSPGLVQLAEMGDPQGRDEDGSSPGAVA